MPDQPGFVGPSTEGIMHPAVLVALVLTILLVLVLPRRRVMVPFLLTTVLVPGGQGFYVGGAHWYYLRIVILAGCVRLATAKFKIAGGLNGIDKAFILWSFCRVVAVMLNSGPAVNLEAFWLESFGGYFLLRYVIQDEEDIVRAAKVLALVAVVSGACMLTERFSDINVFGYLQTGPLIPQTRNGQIRAQAAFGHPILAGCFGATLVPLFFWLWKSGKAKAVAAAGITGSTIMVLMSNSSTPVLAWVAGVGALFLWPIRRSMRAVRWGIVLALVVLALVMKAPVWFVVAHMNVIGGSGGYDRAYLIDVFIKHFWDWWLIGSTDMANWGFDMWDLSNQYVAEGEVGGLLTFVCFITIISRSFSRLGSMRKQVERKEEWLFWSLCAVMLAHVFAYFGVSYWDQTRIWWWTFLAMVSTATVALQNAPTTAESADPKYGAALEAGPDAHAVPAVTGKV